MPHSILVSAFANICTENNNRMRSIYNHVEGRKTVITTNFSHRKKEYYDASEMSDPDQVNLKVPAYKKNLSLSRIWSHLVFAKRLKEYLYSLGEKADTIYCTMPTSASAYVCAKYCKKYGIRFVIDVIDLWPDSLLPLIKGKKVIKAVLYPWTYLTRYAYWHADVIMGESVKYAQEAKRYNQNATVYPVYLGVDVGYINKIKKENKIILNKPSDEIWIGYAGSLGNSYDFNYLLDSVRHLNGSYKYKLWFIGDGVRRQEIESYINDNGINAEITGFLEYEQLLNYLLYCDIAINIFRANTKVVYSYKFNDYVAMNCFVLNSLEGETAQLVDDYKIGKNFGFKDNNLASVLEDTIKNWGKYYLWKDNTQRLIDEKLDKNVIYDVVKEIFK